MQSTTLSRPAATAVSTGKVKAIAAMLFGAAVIFIIGFSNLEIAHNAAHDTRHSAAFPCH